MQFEFVDKKTSSTSRPASPASKIRPETRDPRPETETSSGSSALFDGWLTTEAASGLAKLLLYRNFLFKTSIKIDYNNPSREKQSLVQF